MKFITLFLLCVPVICSAQINQTGSVQANPVVPATSNSTTYAGGSSITDNGSGQITIAAGPTNNNVVITPSGTGYMAVGPSSLTSAIRVGAVSDATTYGAISFNGVLAGATMLGIQAGGDANLYFRNASGAYRWLSGGSTIMTLNSVASSLVVSGSMAANSTTDQSGQGTGSGQFSGGVSIAKSLLVGTGGLTTPGITMGSGTGSVSATSGVFSVATDIRVKNPHGHFVRGLEAIQGLTPVTYDFKFDKKHVERAGFYTQNVARWIPEAVFHDSPDGLASLDDRPITAALVNSVKELARRPGLVEIRLFELIASVSLILSISANRRRT